MKKIMALVLTAVMALALLAGCGGKTNDNTDNNGGDTANNGGAAAISGTVSTDGSTSMEKVIGALSESYMAANKDVTVNYNPTGSGAGITAVQEGTCDIGLSSRALKDEEKAAGLQETVLAYDGIAIIVHPDNPVSDLSIEQIAQQVRDAILTGQVEADEMLPSIRALARDLRVSVITTTRAYSDLVAEGFLANVPGKGYFVLPRDSELVREQVLREVEEHLDRAVERARLAQLSDEELHTMLQTIITTSTTSKDKQ